MTITKIGPDEERGEKPHVYGFVRDGVIVAVNAFSPDVERLGGMTIEAFMETPYAKSQNYDRAVRLDAPPVDENGKEKARAGLDWVVDGDWFKYPPPPETDRFTIDLEETPPEGSDLPADGSDLPADGSDLPADGETP